MICFLSSQWRHNGRNSFSNHQPHDCLLNRLFRRRSKKTSKLRVTGLCAGNSPGTGEFPAQRASNTEYASIWWRHHVYTILHLKKIVHVWVCHFSPCSAPYLPDVYTSGHDRLVDHILFDNRTYILLFSFAYLNCDEDGSSQVHIPVILLILYQYISYIVPIFFIREFLYSYIFDTHSCLTPGQLYTVWQHPVKTWEYTKMHVHIVYNNNI